MRKLLLFLVLFGLGLTLLFLLQRQDSGQTSEALRDVEPAVEAAKEVIGEVAEEAAGEAPGDQPSGPIERPDAGESPAPTESNESEADQDVPGGIGGEFSILIYDQETDQRAYRFRADMENLGEGRYLGREVEVQVFDPVDGELSETIDAERGRLQIGMEGGDFFIADGGRLELEAVDVVRLTEGPFAPLSLNSPSLTVSGLGGRERTMRSGAGDRVVLEGQGLGGVGRGFVVHEREAKFRLEQGGQLRIELGEHGHVMLSTPTGGPIEVAWSEEASEYVLNAKEGARLAFWPVGADAEQDPDSSLDALELTMRGREGPDGIFVPTAVTATTDVRLERGPDQYAGDRAQLLFTSDGRADKASLEGSPRGTVVLESSEGDLVEVELSGSEPLTVDLGALTVFEQAGPARLEVPELGIDLTAEERLSGSIDENSDLATFLAEGSVRLDQGRRVLTTDSLDGQILSAADGSLKAVCSGRTHVVGEDDEGALMDVLASGRTEFVVSRDSWSVPYAESVRFTSEGDPAFQGQTDVLRDLDPQARTFTAEGSVVVENPFGQAAATRAVALGREHLELYGLPDTPASFIVAPPGGGTDSAGFEAQQIDVFADRVVAKGEVVGRVQDAQREHLVYCDTSILAIEPRDEVLEARPFTLECEGVREARMSGEGSETVCSTDHLLATGRLREGVGGGERAVESGQVIATGQVVVSHQGAYELSGSGESFRLEADGSSLLESPSGRRVSAWGNFGEAGVPYRLTADNVRLDGESLQALAPRIVIDAALLPIIPQGEPLPGVTEARGELLRVEEDQAYLIGGAHVEGVDRAGRPLVVDAGTIRLVGTVRQAQDSEGIGWIRGLQATGGFSASYAERARASGDSFVFDNSRVLILGSPAELVIRDTRMVSTRVDVDLESYLVDTDSGWIESVVEEPGWRLDFATLEPVQRDGETLFVIRQPRSVQAEFLTRAEWAVAWLDSEAWVRRGNEVFWGAEPSDEGPVLPMPSMPEVDLLENPFRRLVSQRAARYVEKLYLEGAVELLEAGTRVARTDALLLDLRENTGYMQNAEISTRIDVSGRLENMRTRTDTLRMRADGSLTAKKATLTSCDFAEPHYVVQTGDLELVPRPTGGWRVSIRKNLLRFGGGVRVPLPPIGGLVLDEEGDIKGFETSSGEVVGVETVGVGDSARFGTSVNTGFQTEAGKVGLGVGKIAGFKGSTVRGRWKYDGSFLGSRGILLGIGLELRERDPNKDREEQAWLNMYVSGLDDDGDDKGYVRVQQADRQSFRAWYRARGRYPLSHDEWLDVALSHQSDPAVQSEFFERLYTRFEQRDNELHYRRSDLENYWNASVKLRVDDYRTQVEKLPSAGFFHGNAPIASIGPLKLQYSGSIDVERLRRRQGTIGDPGDVAIIEGFTEYSEEVFTDGLGDQDVTRVNSAHSVELPMSLDIWGLRARPYARTQLTAWDRGLAEEEELGRAGVFAGLELASTLWRRGKNSMIDVTPTFLFEEELDVVDGSDAPLRFDERDDPIEGNRIELGLRSRWKRIGVPRSFDFDVRNVRNWDRGDGRHRDEILFVGRTRTELFGLPFAMRHDFRWDRRDAEVEYWRAALGIAPVEDVNLEFTYTRAAIVTDPLLADALKQDLFDPRFEAVSGRARWRMTPKWEIQVGQTLSLLDDGRLDSELILRRFGHDWLIEIAVNTRQGEGSGFGLSFTPLLTYKPRRLGLLE